MFEISLVGNKNNSQCHQLQKKKNEFFPLESIELRLEGSTSGLTSLVIHMYLQALIHVY